MWGPSGFTGGVSAAATPRSGRADAIEELLDLGLQMQALARQVLGRCEHAVRGLAGLVGALRRVADIDGDISRSARRRANALRDVLRRPALLLDRRRNRGGDIADAFDGLADRLDRADRLFGRKLHVADLAGDLLGRLRGLAREALDLLRHHGKDTACVAR